MNRPRQGKRLEKKGLTFSPDVRGERGFTAIELKSLKGPSRIPGTRDRKERNGQISKFDYSGKTFRRGFCWKKRAFTRLRKESVRSGLY